MLSSKMTPTFISVIECKSIPFIFVFTFNANIKFSISYLGHKIMFNLKILEMVFTLNDNLSKNTIKWKKKFIVVANIVFKTGI